MGKISQVGIMEEITIKDIARICKVGVSTVSRAINNHPDINPETKKMIMDVIAEYGYIPNNSARNLKRTDARCIAILVKGISNPFFSNMIKVIEEEVEKKRYSLVLRHVEYEEDEVDVALELIKEKRLRGIIFLGGYFYHSVDKLEKLNVPYILSTAGCIPENMNKNHYSSFTVDDEKEGFLLTSYLIELGHKDIAILSGETENISVGQLRLSGYKRALKEHGIKLKDNLICPMKNDVEYYSMQNGYEVTKSLLESGQKVTAMFAISDVLAVGACRAIIDMGKRVPEDISVAGYDGIELVKYYNPTLTTVKQPVNEMAKASINLLFDIISGKQQNQHRIFEGEIIVGESTTRLEE